MFVQLFNHWVENFIIYFSSFKIIIINCANIIIITIMDFKSILMFNFIIKIIIFKAIIINIIIIIIFILINSICEINRKIMILFQLDCLRTTESHSIIFLILKIFFPKLIIIIKIIVVVIILILIIILIKTKSYLILIIKK